MKYILSTLCLLFVLNIAQAQKKVNWLSWEQAITAAAETPKKIYVDIYTDWCGYCKKMDRETFTDPGVIKYLNDNFYAVKFDAEQKEEIMFNETSFKHRPGGRGGVHELAVALLNNQMGYPAFVILDEEFARILISPGFKGASDVMMEMKYANEELYKTKHWNAYKAEQVALKRASEIKANPSTPATPASPATKTKPLVDKMPATSASKGKPATPSKPTTSAQAKTTTNRKPQAKARTPESKQKKDVNVNVVEISESTTPNSENEEVLKVVEQMPRFPGCEGQGLDKNAVGKCAQDKMLQYIYNNLKYPSEAKENGIDGMVVLQFKVEKDGSINDAKIIRDVKGGCGAEALRVVNSMPAWTPGMNKGEKVAVLYTLPVRFNMEKKAKKKDIKE